ncbi:MAG: hypothetical protein JJU36_02240 [Phycisphaeraceae bacterium]|nr:hypothetical protein [Phycisphaeraceae bacterium]
MAKRPDLTRGQQRIVKRYYEHQDTIRSNNLAEIVSELYLAETEGRRKQLWTRARKALEGLKADPVTMQRVLESQDVAGLAKLAERLGRQ